VGYARRGIDVTNVSVVSRQGAYLQIETMATSFLLSKWYLDVVDRSGNGLIAYQADLSWGRLRLRYDGLIPIGQPGFRERGNFRSASAVTESIGLLSWSADTVSGTWVRRSPEVSHELLHSKEGTVCWRCAQPSSDVCVHMGDQELKGLGYAEKLDLSLAPWRLPIRELLWGRYVSPQHALTWIRWSGPEPRVILFFNGHRVEPIQVTASEISFADYSLRLPSTVVRDGTLGDTVLRGAGRLKALLPRSIFSLREEKWGGPAELWKGQIKTDTGYVIHERVLWP
jgi:hypothetical protein